MNHPQPVSAPTPEAQRWEQLEQSPLAQAVAAAGVGVWEIEMSSGEEWWSDTTLAMYGLPPGSKAPTRSEWRERFVHPHDLPRCLARAEELSRTGQPYEMEYRILRAGDGAVRWLLSRSAFKFGDRQRVLGITVDITDRREAEARAREATAWLEHAARQVGFGFGVREPGGDQGWWSPDLKRLWGLAVDAPTPRWTELLAMIAPGDRDRVWRELNTPIAPGSQVEFSFQVIKGANGQPRMLTTRASTQYDEQGRAGRTFFAVSDTTERHTAEAALQAQALAERANAAKTEFLSRMSHELRTPLNAVLGFAQLMALDTADPLSPTQQQRVEQVQTAGWHLLALVNDVLDLSRIESRQAPVVQGDLALAPLVQQCLDMLAPLAQRQEVALRWEPGTEEGTTLCSDATRLLQLLLNLVSNGIKYNRAGGWVEVAASRHAGQLVLSVRDNGQGMTDAQRAQLFQPFNRLGRESSGIEGTGLGLALCKLIAEQLGATLEADSVLGQGSEFRLLMPLPASPPLPLR